jgi:ABC-type dipeptide/oligopeptide/nickel transport system permease subunit
VQNKRNDKNKSNLQRIVARIFSGNVARLSALVILVALVCALFSGWIAPKDPYEQELSRRLKPPVGFEGSIPGYYLGTDQLGRDILSRIILGARISLLISGVAVTVAALLGVAAGLLAGYYGGKVDLFIMRLVDIQLAFPVVLMVLAIVAVVGPSLFNLTVVMGISGWPRFARIARASVLSVKVEGYVDAAHSIGASTYRVMIHHILLNCFSPLIVFATFELARMILLEATLSYLGLGVQPPTPTWGGMINDGKQYIYMSWAVSVIPGIAIALIILSFNMLGDELSDALDPQVAEE